VAVYFVLGLLYLQIGIARGLPQPALGWDALGMLTSWRDVADRIFVNLHSAVLWSIVWLFLLVLLRVVLRRDGLALFTK
jgi:hypothetical protein